MKDTRSVVLCNSKNYVATGSALLRELKKVRVQNPFIFGINYLKRKVVSGVV